MKPEDDGVKVASKHTPVFPQMDRKPLRAKQGANVTQMHYARNGIITSEMEYVAIREGVDPNLFVRKSRKGALFYQRILTILKQNR